MNDDQFTELKHYLGERFDTQDAKLEKRLTEQDAGMKSYLNEELAKFAGQVNRRFADLEATLDTKADKQDLDRIYGALDTILKNQETEQQERAAITVQLDRHERWHHQTADVLHLKLDY